MLSIRLHPPSFPPSPLHVYCRILMGEKGLGTELDGRGTMEVSMKKCWSYFAFWWIYFFHFHIFIYIYSCWICLKNLQLMIFSLFGFRIHRGRLWSRSEEGASDLLPLSDPGAGEGVSFQSLLDPTKEDRDRQCPLPNWTPDQDLVPKQEDEMEKRKQLEFHPVWGRWRWSSCG